MCVHGHGHICTRVYVLGAIPLAPSSCFQTLMPHCNPELEKDALYTGVLGRSEGALELGGKGAVFEGGLLLCMVEGALDWVLLLSE